MIVVGLDPALADLSALALPDLERFIAGAVSCRHPGIGMCFSRAIVDDLYAAGRYPTYTNCKAYLAATPSEILDVATVARVYAAFTERSVSLEHQAMTDDFVADAIQTSMSSFFACGDELCDARIRTALLLLLATEFGASDASFLWGPTCIMREALSIQAQSLMVKRYGGDVAEISTFSATTNLEVDLQAALRRIDGAGILSKNHGHATVLLLSMVITLEMLKRSILPIDEILAVKKFVIAESFVTSFNDARLGTRGNIYGACLEAMVDAIFEERMRKVHALRVGPGPEDAQMVWDTMRAWRRDVDDEYHIHYWTDPMRQPRFVNFGVHNDFRMPRA